MEKRLNQQKGGMEVLVGIVVLIFLMGVGIFLVSTHGTEKKQSIADTTTNRPDVKVTDYAQGSPQSQKTAVLVEHSDSTFEKFIMLNTMVDDYVKHLPPGEKVVSKTPLSQ